MCATAVVNVRMGSTRLPGKVLRSVGERPLLSYLLTRLRCARSLGRLIVATSQLTVNDAIADFCADFGVECFRGSEEDVLSRTLSALRSCNAKVGVVVFGDGPLIDPTIVDRVVDTYLESAPRFDFVGNDLSTTYPPGMEVEAFSVEALTDAERCCIDSSIREHGTLHLRRHPEKYRLLNLEAPPHLRRPDLELEVDTEADLQVMTQILGYFSGRMDFTLTEMIAFLDAHPEIADINRAVPRNWRTHRSDRAMQRPAEREP